MTNSHGLGSRLSEWESAELNEISCESTTYGWWPCDCTGGKPALGLCYPSKAGTPKPSGAVPDGRLSGPVSPFRGRCRFCLPRLVPPDKRPSGPVAPRRLASPASWSILRWAVPVRETWTKSSQNCPKIPKGEPSETPPTPR